MTTTKQQFTTYQPTQGGHNKKKKGEHEFEKFNYREQRIYHEFTTEDEIRNKGNYKLLIQWNDSQIRFILGTEGKTIKKLKNTPQYIDLPKPLIRELNLTEEHRKINLTEKPQGTWTLNLSEIQ